MNRFKIISLVIALLVAQLSYAGHYHSADEYHSETECFLCVHASFLDSAIPSAYLINIDVAIADSLTIVEIPVIPCTQFNEFNPRAPPLS